MTLTLSLTPRRAALLRGYDNRLDVLVRAAAPEQAVTASLAKSLNLALVIDRSGSMNGQPLHEAKRCASAMIDRMSPTDHVSVIAYDDQIAVIHPAGPVADKAAIKRAIDAIEAGGRTALHAGWLAGAEQAAKHLKAADLTRVLLLSDGQANVGPSDPADLADQCAQLSAKGVTTSTYGLGAGFNEDLMSAMARAGEGSAYYGRTAEDLTEPFAREFDLLRALFAQQVRLRLEAGESVSLKVANAYPLDDGAWRLPDVAYGAEAWALVRLKVPADLVESAGDGRLRLLTARLEFTVGGEPTLAGPVHLDLPTLPVAAYDVIAGDDVVALRAQELEFAQILEDARRFARARDWDRVDSCVRRAERLAEGNAWLVAGVETIRRYAALRDEASLSKEAHYKSSTMTSRLTSRFETRDFDAASESVRPSFMRRKREEGRKSESDGQ